MTIKHESWLHFIKERRKNHTLNLDEEEIINSINRLTVKNNADNISRTVAYQDYFFRMKEIEWSFLAGMVSRNAGYNMTDLENSRFKNGIDKKQRNRLFITYERSNWIIFSDAFPQLLLFEYSIKLKKPLFYLLKYFSVSIFMEIEWEKYWTDRKKERLVYALIINEQNMIEHPVIQDAYFKSNVFDTISYKLQEQLRLTHVIFPTLTGELYGMSIFNFQELGNRIKIGKQLYSILFLQSLNELFFEYALKVPHSGSRNDYEQIVGISNSNNPKLREVYPIIPHKRTKNDDWFMNNSVPSDWFKRELYTTEQNFKEVFLSKIDLLNSLLKVKSFFE